MNPFASLVYLHGIGGGDEDGRWRTSLESTLQRVGYPNLSSVVVAAPKYAEVLHGVEGEDSLPGVNFKPLRGDPLLTSRRAYERRRTSMEVMLGKDDSGAVWPVVGDLVAPATKTRWFKQAANFRDDPKVRAAVLWRVLDSLPPAERLVIIGHSLGSVVAADLLCRLSPDTKSVTLITLGSPLSHRDLHVDGLNKMLPQPPSHLEYWINFWSTADFVTAGGGVGRHFPWVLDQRVSSSFGVDPTDAHRAATYLQHESVATAIGFGLFGSRDRSLVPASRRPEPVLGTAETLSLLALRYLHLIARHLDGERQGRFVDGLRQVQTTEFQSFSEVYESRGELLPPALETLRVDLTDPSSVPSIPDVPTSLSMDDAVMPLVAIIQNNLLAPYEIDVPEDVQKKALSQLTLDMGLGSGFGVRVLEANERAWKVLGSPLNWKRLAAVGVGAVALTIATGGLMLAAAPGAVGAAAITSALAAFGPGGMVGGLLTAGSLVTVGGGSLAIGLAQSSTPAAAVESMVAARLTAVIVRKRLGLPPDATLQQLLSKEEADVAKTLDHQRVISDESAPSLKELQRKLDALSRALAFLRRECGDEHLMTIGPGG